MKKISLLTFFCLVLFFMYFITIIHAENNMIKPEIALIEEGGWGGALNPEFVLYNNGFVIYGKYYDEYFCTMLTKKEKEIFIKSLKTDKLNRLKNNYEITAGCHDCSTYHLYLWNQNFIKKISAYGILNEDNVPLQGSNELINALKVLSSFKEKTLRIWIPEKIKVRVVGYDDSKTHIAWPRNWPALKSSEWTEGEGGVYTRFFDRNELNLLKKMEKKQNLLFKLFNSDSWRVNYRFPFPEEDIWITDIHKYDINYYSDEINILGKEMEADALKKNIPTPTDRFYYYHEAAKELKKKMGLKYNVD